jgi:hypothetical protein
MLMKAAPGKQHDAGAMLTLLPLLLQPQHLLPLLLKLKLC